MPGSPSRRRLERLIADRARPGADKEAIDRRIWHLLGDRRAVMFTDLSGFSRTVAEFGIIHFLQMIYESIEMFVPLIEAENGILLKAEADSLLVTFRHPDQAMACAIAMQNAARRHNEQLPPEEHILLCLGLGYGDVLLVGDEDVFGAEVNAASKLGEDVARSYEILATENFRANLTSAAELGFENLDFVPPGARAAYKVIYPAA